MTRHHVWLIHYQRSWFDGGWMADMRSPKSLYPAQYEAVKAAWLEQVNLQPERHQLLRLAANELMGSLESVSQKTLESDLRDLATIHDLCQRVLRLDPNPPYADSILFQTLHRYHERHAEAEQLRGNREAALADRRQALVWYERLQETFADKLGPKRAK